jgi:hypothetical protein
MMGATSGCVRVLLRFEGACVLVAALLSYSRSGFGWSMFALCFLAPDLSFLGYLAGARIGAIAYNTAHSYIGPIACLVAASMLAAPALSAAALIWGAHVGFDRALGYGLKYAAGFGHTHLGRIGRQAETGALRRSSA